MNGFQEVSGGFEYFVRRMQGKAERVDISIRACVPLAKIKSAFKINNIQRGCVTCYMDDIQTSQRFGEGHMRNVFREFKMSPVLVYWNR
jgi:hypothetical protein